KTGVESHDHAKGYVGKGEVTQASCRIGPAGFLPAEFRKNPGETPGCRDRLKAYVTMCSARSIRATTLSFPRTSRRLERMAPTLLPVTASAVWCTFATSF